jgi:RuvB-like protein 1 (pontin 52)
MAATSNENNMKIEQVKTAPHEKRVATHSHIKGLGLRADGTAEPIQSGFVGQENAREVCWLFIIFLIALITNFYLFIFL